MSYTEKVAAKIANDYEPSGSLTYIFNRKHFLFKTLAGPSFSEQLLNKFHASGDESQSSLISSMDNNTVGSSYQNQSKLLSNELSKQYETKD